MLVVIHLNITTITAKATMTFTTSPIGLRVLCVDFEGTVDDGRLPEWGGVEGKSGRSEFEVKPVT